ncbi:MAG: hypothetical protein SFV53_02900 [Rickettsiales bacterium]|nr:hypothetical protein [Rickettsiales bacterium]
MKAIKFLLIFLSITSCVMPNHSGFYNPITLDMRVPDGPPEYKAGWHDGCQTGSSIKSFANNDSFQKDGGPNFGSGVYTHDPVYQSGWSQGWFACVINISNFVGNHSMRFSPLD